MELNKQDEKLLQELLKKYKQGIVSGLYPGTNITFTPTGCRDKVISSSGGSGGDSQTLSISSDILTISDGNSVTLPIGLFPNGYNFIDTDYVLQASDEGKLIIALAETPIHITVPTGSDVFTNKIIGIAMISSGDFEIEPSVAVNPLHQTNDGLGVGDLKCETVICQTFTGDGINSLSVLSTSVINDNGSYKTMLRYLYDKSQDAIPLSGTETGNPVTGMIYVENDLDDYGFRRQNTDNLTGVGFSGLSGIINYVDLANNEIAQITVDNNGIFIEDQLSGISRGIQSTHDYSANITDLDYTQKKYVDTHIAFTSVPTSSSDTGVKGQMAVDANYLYICTATNTWTRIALTW